MAPAANRSGRAREVLVALPIGRNAKVEGADGLDFESSSSTPLAKFTVESGARDPDALVTTAALVRRYSVADLTWDLLEPYATDDRLPEATRKVLLAVQQRVHAHRQVGERITALNARFTEVERDIARLREHLKSAGGDGGSAAGTGRLVGRLLRAEDLREELVSKRRAAARELDTSRAAIESVLATLG